MRETVAQRGARAAAVSRTLHRRGINVLGSGTSRNREGVRVSGGILGTTHVAVDLDTPSERDALTEAVVAALKSAGYTVEANAEAPWSLTVKKG